ncbi:DUF6281 family protein [Streptomyces scabiei]|nr:DUF6281 family protein [Streptomyces scabiei]MDW8474582.1 DUF6281 family protein [Streptomyces scabiei]
MTPLAVGCAALETGGTSSASCVFAVDYDDRTYVDAGKVRHTLGAEVGTARDSVCEDQGGGEEDRVAPGTWGTTRPTPSRASTPRTRSRSATPRRARCASWSAWAGTEG